MLIIEVKSGENIEQVLKRYKQKFNKTWVKKQLNNRKQYSKPSINRRAQLQKAQYIQGLRDVELM